MNWKKKQILLIIICLSLFCISSCKKSKNFFNMDPFIQMARSASCADMENRIFLIENKLVLTLRHGNCPDASFHIALYQEDPDHILCEFYDSIAGPVKNIYSETFRSMFEIIINNQDQNNFGLGSMYEIVEIHF